MASELDDLDYSILDVLMKDSKVPYTDIAKELFVSSGTIHVRMKKMEQMGIVKGSQLKIDYSALGYDVTAFLGIYLDKSYMYEDSAKFLLEIPEIVSVHYTTGVYSIFAKIVCRDTKHLRDVLHDKIQRIEGIQRTETFISLQESLDRPINLKNQ